MKYYTLCCLFFCSAFLNAQIDVKHWNDIPEENLPEKERWIVPDAYRVVETEQTDLESFLAQLPLEYTNAAPGLLEIPFPDGTYQLFEMYNSPIAEKELEEKFPMIRNFRGQGLTEPSATIRCDVTSKGFHAIVHSQKGTVYIDPYFKEKTTYYNVYFKHDCSTDDLFECEVENDIVKSTKPVQNGQLKNPQGLRTYRAAIAATGEYTAFHSVGAPNVIDGLSAINTTLMRVNSVFEVDFGTRLLLIANNNLIVYTNGSTDPYTSTNNSGFLNQNQTNIDNVIGFGNYDIGHLFNVGQGGVASLGSVCTSSKSRGYTALPSPMGEPFDIDYVAHEMGHQFDANHTQNNNCNNVGGESYEPGSASTIMGYAGICSPDVQSNSDDHFHAGSLDDIIPFVSSGCGQWVTTGNNAPSVNAGSNYSIPIGTPFFLEAVASDVDGDALTYCWEQMDAASATMPPSANSTVGPAFRSNSPELSPTRYLPNLNDLVNNVSPTWEVLSNVQRNYNWRVTVRDNHSGGGCTDSDDMVVSVQSSSGPFLVTAPNTAVSWVGGQSQTVSWNVAGTTGGNVNCPNVDILLSTDGGFTYPTVLASSVPNDGSETITVPNLNSFMARVMVRCSDNIFFDISNTDFNISPLAGDITINSEVVLGGNYDTASGLMTDDLRTQNLIPLTEPFTALGFTHTGGGGGESTTAAVLNVSGPNAIVDWVLLEIRYKTIPIITIATVSALLQRDGDIVSVDGVTPPKANGNFLYDDYYLAVRHRNHLGVMSAAPINFQTGSNVSVDFSVVGMNTFGTDAMMNTGGVNAMWPGNGNADGTVIYQGSGSDILPITQAVFSNPLNTAFQLSMPYVAYDSGDYNLDGSVIYQGSGSDILYITQSVFTHPSNTAFQLTFPIVEQLP